MQIQMTTVKIVLTCLQAKQELLSITCEDIEDGLTSHKIAQCKPASYAELCTFKRNKENILYL